MGKRTRRGSGRKIFTGQSRLGQLGVNLVERLILAMGSRWDPTNATEIGVDGLMELCEPTSGEPTGLRLAVQCKAVTKFEREGDAIVLTCRRRDIDYWLASSLPVVLVVCEPKTHQEAYWLSVRDYFGNPEKFDGTKAVFDQRQHLTANSYDALLDLVRPPAGEIPRSPMLGAETLYSNLLPLHSYPSTIFIAATSCRGYPDAWARLRETAPKDDRTHISRAWLLHNKCLYSFVDPSVGPLTTIADAGTVESHDARDWAESEDPNRRRLFAQLLNNALRDDLGGLGIRFTDDDQVYFFKGSLEQPVRKWQYDCVRQPSTMTVVRDYDSAGKDGRTYRWLRHHACRARFRRLGSRWYVELTPTYRFTTDGLHKYRFHEERLSKIKRIERNQAVFHQVLLWSDVLRPKPSLFTTRKHFLEFEAPFVFSINRTIPDADWAAHDEPVVSHDAVDDIPLLMRTT